MQIRHGLLLLTSALALQGCIAVAAIPILASGGAIAYSRLSGERTRQAIAEGTEIEAATVDVAVFAEYTLLDMEQLPAPVAPVPTTGAYGAFHSRTSALMATHFPTAQDAARPELPASALLDNPAELEPERAPCAEAIPALLIDLDPEGGLMPIEGSIHTDPSLVAAVDDLRRQGTTIAWITDREPQDAGVVRRRLLEAGLDPTGRDPLFVQRYPGELKQARRRALLETHCVLAIAGDARPDFDDLYAYLRDPSFAVPLEAMIGDRWFLIPNPID